MIDEETLHKLIAVGLLITIGMLWYINHQVSTFELPDQDLSPVIDIIYEQCSEEGHINLTTIKGRSKTLEYTNGVCVIK